MTDAPRRQRQANFQSNLIAGLLTVTPLIVVWLVFDFFLTTLSNWGHPLAVELTIFLDSHFPVLQPWLDNDAVRYAIGIVVALLALYRSEERRVGKECRSWWWRDPYKKNKIDAMAS